MSRHTFIGLEGTDVSVFYGNENDEVTILNEENLSNVFCLEDAIDLYNQLKRTLIKIHAIKK